MSAFFEILMLTTMMAAAEPDITLSASKQVRAVGSRNISPRVGK
jgi:hypothetical protein